MTDQPTNRLLGKPRLVSNNKLPAFIDVKGEQVPTDLDDYCAWLNRKDRRRGLWRVVKMKDDDERREIIWVQETGSDSWLREQGLAPQIGKRA
jgi:hypothetical protein